MVTCKYSIKWENNSEVRPGPHLHYYSMKKCAKHHPAAEAVDFLGTAELWVKTKYRYDNILRYKMYGFISTLMSVKLMLSTCKSAQLGQHLLLLSRKNSKKPQKSAGGSRWKLGFIIWGPWPPFSSVQSGRHAYQQTAVSAKNGSNNWLEIYHLCSF